MNIDSPFFRVEAHCWLWEALIHPVQCNVICPEMRTLVLCRSKDDECTMRSRTSVGFSQRAIGACARVLARAQGRCCVQVLFSSVVRTLGGGEDHVWAPGRRLKHKENQHVDAPATEKKVFKVTVTVGKRTLFFFECMFFCDRSSY